MKTKIVLVALVLVLGLSLIGAWRWSQPNNPGATAPATPLPNLSAPKLAAQSTASQVAAPALPAAPASSSGPVSDKVADNPQLQAAMQDIVKLVAAKDYVTLVRTYLPTKVLRNLGPDQDEAVQKLADDPQQQEMLQTFAGMLGTVQDATPVYNADRTSVHIRYKPDAAAVVMMYTDGGWRIAGIEYPQPPNGDSGATAPASPKKTPNPSGGGYVP